ncbi:MAG: hypothetical protein DRH30_11085 [Deltaproteobacteria bacterium]|nr:MAG: hypothetical protein DRH30_11085 [Deltaproteobacteria bacterium]RLB68625.1 MAG: hypothetical protein DRH08_00195 [Deltaproteobacteria bacterium]
MENDSDPSFMPDVQPSGSAIVKHEEATALARKIAGEDPPDECRFHCVTCGWGKTLKFEEDEAAALAGDITSYGGPCGECGSMTLVPYASLMGDETKTVLQNAKAIRREEYQEQAEVLVDRVKSEVAVMMGGSTLSPTPEEEMDPESVHDPRTAAQKAMDSVSEEDLENLKPRGE